MGAAVVTDSSQQSPGLTTQNNAVSCTCRQHRRTADYYAKSLTLRSATSPRANQPTSYRAASRQTHFRVLAHLAFDPLRLPRGFLCRDRRKQSSSEQPILVRDVERIVHRENLVNPRSNVSVTKDAHGWRRGLAPYCDAAPHLRQQVDCRHRRRNSLGLLELTRAPPGRQHKCFELSSNLHSTLRGNIRSGNSHPRHFAAFRAGRINSFDAFELCELLRAALTRVTLGLLRADRNIEVAHISVHAFGTAMIFSVPDDADMSGFHFAGVRSRADAQEQLNDYLESLGYNSDDSYKW